MTNQMKYKIPTTKKEVKKTNHHLSIRKSIKQNFMKFKKIISNILCRYGTLEL